MATYFLRVKHVSRGKGARVTRAAAYRAGECIRDERTSEVHNHTARQDVAYKEVVLPADLAGRADMAWTQDRSTLWNAAEHAGLRRNSRLAREWLMFVPVELDPVQRVALVRAFAGELADKYRCAVDLCIHRPRTGADARNHHAHLLMTTREVTPEGLGPRTTLELGGWERHKAGLGATRDEYLLLRERWADLTNEALAGAGLAERVDHRSLELQGTGREPVPSIPEKVFYAERKSGPSDAGDAIRARHRQRAEARQISGEALAGVMEQQKTLMKERAAIDLERRKSEPAPIRWNALTREERNAHRREQYEARRIRERQDPAYEAQRREAARKEYHTRMLKNPEAVRAQRRHWRQSNVEEVNRKQRAYRAGRAERQTAKAAVSTEERSAMNWQAYRESQTADLTAETAAANWLGMRGSQAALNPEQPASSGGARQGTPENIEQNDEPASKTSLTRDSGLGL